MDRARASSLVPLEDPAREELRALEALAEQLADAIAEREVELEDRRRALAAFERQVHAAHRHEHLALGRVMALLRHYERWERLLDDAARRGSDPTARAARTDDARTREVDRAREEREEREAREAEQPDAPPRGEPTEADAPGEASDAGDTSSPTGERGGRRDRLRAAYRTLVRRFHPDLAATEDERVRRGGIMAEINRLYAEKDVEALERMVREGDRAGASERPMDVAEALRVMKKRVAWLRAVLENLDLDARVLERSQPAELATRVQRGLDDGRDILEELRAELEERIHTAVAELPKAIRLVEHAVTRYNRHTTLPAPKPRDDTALDRAFDPLPARPHIRVSLEALDKLSASPAAGREARAIEAMADAQPALLDVLLLTFASELATTPLAGLERFDDVHRRFLALRDEAGSDNAEGAEGVPPGGPTTLEAALVELDGRLEYGVRKVSGRRAQMGLRFRSETTREALPLALRAHAVRRRFCRVLAVLDEEVTCGACGETVFAMPLFRLRGLDDLRASVCPACGHTLKRYWMPKGTDVQAVLNDAFVDLELVVEFVVRLGRASCGFQLLPVELERMTVADLKDRLVADLFEKYALDVARADVRLVARGDAGRLETALDESTPLELVEPRTLDVAFTDAAPLELRDAVEMLQHRIRTRFSPDAEDITPAPRSAG
jgi:hypothetical protein